MKIHQTRKLFTAGILPKPKPTQDIAMLSERLDAATFQTDTPSSAAPHHCGKRQQPTASPTPSPHGIFHTPAKVIASKTTSNQ